MGVSIKTNETPLYLPLLHRKFCPVQNFTHSSSLLPSCVHVCAHGMDNETQTNKQKTEYIGMELQAIITLNLYLELVT